MAAYAFRNFLFVLVVLSTGLLKAQEFEWLKGFKGSNRYAVRADSLGAFVLLNSPTDTFVTDDLRVTGSPTSPILIRLDSTGKARSAKRIVTMAPGTALYGIFCLDAASNIYFLGNTIGTGSIQAGNTTLQSTNGNTILIKLDSSFNQVWARQFGGEVPILDQDEITYKDGRIFILKNVREEHYQIGNNTYHFPNPVTEVSSILAEVDPQNGSVLWSSLVYPNTQNNYCIASSLTLVDNDLYVSAIAREAVFGTDTINSTAMILRFSGSGVYKNKLVLVTGNDLPSNHTKTAITSSGNNLYFSGSFTDTAIIGRDTLVAEFAHTPYARDFFLASVTKDLVPRWAYDPEETVSPPLVTANNRLPFLFSRDEFIYFSDIIVVPTNFKGNTVGSISTVFVSLLLGKIDSLGNFLWVTSSGEQASVVSSFDGYPGRGIYAGGLAFLDNLIMGDFSLTPADGLNFLVRISDYSIRRGEVYAGPYCAGDTIKIPYTISGKFDTVNYFIAELSNEKGEFNGTQRELGRIKSNVNDTIRGLLPLFQVASSDAYRIRVRASNPAVQSFYRKDTLRLLIYSRDSADAGPDITICPGDTVNLSTFGGTKWRWSPGYRMSDSTIRSPKVWPAEATTYRIAISDSSGCGVVDTAYKTIFIRPPLKISSAFTDTTVCNALPLMLKVNLSGSDSLNYALKWYCGGTLLRENVTGTVTEDTLSVALVSKDSAGTVYTVLLHDHCALPDSTELKIRTFMEPAVAISADRACADPTVNLSARAVGYAEGPLFFSWTDGTSQPIGSGDSITFSPLQPTPLYVKMTDGCTVSETTDTLWIYPQPRINVSVSDTAACEPYELELTISKLTGTQNVYTLFRGMQQLTDFSAVSHSVLLNEGRYSCHLMIESEGGCKDIVTLPEVTIYPLPRPDFGWNPAQPNWDDKELHFVNLSQGAVSYEWDIADFGIHTGFEPMIPITDSGTYRVQLHATSDKGCTDTAIKQLKVLPTFALYVPNAFTPNGDGHNPVFAVQGTGFASYTIDIYNRWGQVIFSGNQHNYWDGTFKGNPVPEGSYTYIINLVDLENNFRMYNGMVTVLR